MKRLAFFLILFASVIFASAANKASKELASFIKAMVEEQSIHPDSMYVGIVKLEAQKDALTEPTEKAIYQAVLGYLYHNYANTASAHMYQSDSDSTSMRSWSRDDYYRMASKRYAEALADMELLHKAKISDWSPLVEKGRDDAVYDNDMLMLIWSSADRSGGQIPSWEKMLEFYQKHGNRKAMLMLRLSYEYWGSNGNVRRDNLLKLREEYKELDMCGEIYYQLSLNEVIDSARVHWLQEGLKLYPRYKYKVRLQECLQEILSPRFSIELNSAQPYPGKAYRWILRLQNVQQVKLAFYRLNDSFDQSAYQHAKDDLKYLQQNATKLSDEVHQSTVHPAWERFNDTLQWTAPELGRYALVALPVTAVKQTQKLKPSVCLFNVSRLMLNCVAMPNGIERVMVSDAVSGKPIEGADVTLNRRNKKSTDADYIVLIGKTDSNGNIDITWPKNKNNYYESGCDLKVTYADDLSHPVMTLYYGASGFQRKTESYDNVNLYTDRSIYRPGQVVHLGGVDSHREDWDEQVRAGVKHKIVMFNPNGKQVAEQTAESDSLGVFAADFTLPESGLTGGFRFTVDGRCNHYVQVEEYKRPTFEVTTDEAPAIQMPADSITLTGRAMMYSGAPVRGARVATQFRWNDYWWRWGGRTTRGRYDTKLDTVLTDDKGRFSVTIPISQSKAQLRYGKILSVHYDVVSPTGETHTAEHSVLMCSSPLLIQANIPGMNDRDKLTPWSMNLLTSTGAEVEGDIQVTLKQGKKVVFKSVEKSGNSVIPNSIKNAPSGRYDLQLLAVVNGDSAFYRREIVLFSQRDTKLPVDSTLWVYVPERNMSADKAARVQIGSTKDVYLRYLLVSDAQVVSDHLMHLKDTVLTIDIPYEKCFGKALTLNVMLVKDEKIHSQSTNLLLTQPDKELKHKWITFRDKLQPGQKETWQLQLLTPDGKPATANLMASLYDASLDAVHQHNWYFHHTMNYSPFNNSYSTLTSRGRVSVYGNFYLKQFDARYYEFARINSSLFEQNAYGYVSGYGSRRSSRAGDMFMLESVPVMAKSAGLAVLERKAVFERREVNASEFEGLGINSVDEAMQGRIAGLDVVSVAEEADPVVTLRENFDETAFFYPTLRTDAQGEVTLSFTLPESLTTWRLLGLAHTENMLTTLLDEKVVAQKDLMAQLSLPRFLRQGDKGSLSASIYNISKVYQKGRGVLTVLDAATEKVLLKQRLDFNLKAESDTTVLIPFNVPGDAGMLICRWAAEGSTCSDGEQRYLPVLSNKEWMTDTRTLTYTKAGNYKEDVSEMFAVMGATNKQLTIEYVSHPVWYAIQALPSLVWPKQNDVLSMATAYYAGSVSAHIAQQNPGISGAIDSWKDNGLLQKSKLLQNDDLKNLIIEETPWVAEAEAETERIQRLSTLFDPSTQSSLQKEYLDKMRKQQNSDGSFSWYPGMKGSYYMTREVAYILTRLKVLTGSTANSMLQQAIGYIRQDRPTYLGTSSLRYLYVLYQSGVQMDKADRHNADSLLRVLVKHPEELDLEQRALAAIILKKAGKNRDSERYLETVKKFLVTNKEGLTYFEFPQGSHYSINRKMHVHVQVMEALAMLSPKDSVLLDGMRRYLLRHKRTSEWDTPVNTANAVYSLLLNNGGALEQGCDAEISLVQSKRKTAVKSEGTAFGYVRDRIDVEGPVSTVEIQKKGEQESWGGLYAQYLAPLSDIAASQKGDLSIKVEMQQSKDVGKANTLQSGKLTNLQAGNRVHVRYLITAEKDYEYVSIHAPRPATAEPVSQMSGFCWCNGLGYYRAVKDAAVNFFIDYLPRGSYVIEEDWLIERSGEYSTGITSIQCLYAPEFSGHSTDTKVIVK